MGRTRAGVARAYSSLALEALDAANPPASVEAMVIPGSREIVAECEREFQPARVELFVYELLWNPHSPCLSLDR